LSVLFCVNHVLEEHSGVKRKILDQVSAIQKITSKKVYLSYLRSGPESNCRMIENLEIDKFNRLIPLQICAALSYSNIYKFIVSNKIKTVYIRYTQFSNFYFLSFLKKLNRQNIRVIMEIPTFPYDNEIKKGRNLKKLQSVLEKATRKKMVSYVSDLLTFTDEHIIFGKETTRLANAAPSLTNYELKSLSNLPTRNRFDLLCVARLEWWHGYDRLIRSLAAYRADEQVHIHIVGNGPEYKKLQALTDELSLSKNITFYGSKSGKELTDIKSNCHIGIDSLGRHRSGNAANSSLKSKEYLTFGLPVVIGHHDPSLINFEKYVFKVSADDKNFSIQKIIDWYKSSAFERLKISEESISSFNWVSQFKKVFE
jgi:glycosyltransferase involved in cell wall biosynthesis